tara:strand:- start:78 stop:518 length:441 start_codon:yes stop_codon:yes gene_type:complete
MAKLQFTMERGGVLTAGIFVDRVPETWKAIQTMLPHTATALNARWSGREFFSPMVIPEKPPRENQTHHASLGDIIYACERPDDRQFTGFEAIGLFYGAESINDWRGPFAVNWIGRIDPSQWELIEAIGDRIFRHGGEQCEIRVIED